MSFQPSMPETNQNREKAVLAAFRAAWAEYEIGPCDEPEDAAYTWGTATARAHHELIQAFPDRVAERLAHGLARTARAHFRPQDDSESV